MAYPTPVNDIVTDAISQANVTALAGAPSSAANNLAQIAAHSFGLMMQNAVARQQNSATCMLAAATRNVAIAAKLGQSDVPDNMLRLLSALRAGTATLPVA